MHGYRYWGRINMPAVRSAYWSDCVLLGKIALESTYRLPLRSYCSWDILKIVPFRRSSCTLHTQHNAWLISMMREHCVCVCVGYCHVRHSTMLYGRILQIDFDANQCFVEQLLLNCEGPADTSMNKIDFSVFFFFISMNDGYRWRTYLVGKMTWKWSHRECSFV